MLDFLSLRLSHIFSVLEIFINLLSFSMMLIFLVYYFVMKQPELVMWIADVIYGVGWKCSMLSVFNQYYDWLTMSEYRFSAFWLRSKCSICSYQLNIWYGPHVGPTILNCFLEDDEVLGACTTFVAHRACIALTQASVHLII